MFCYHPRNAHYSKFWPALLGAKDLKIPGSGRVSRQQTFFMNDEEETEVSKNKTIV